MQLLARLLCLLALSVAWSLLPSAAVHAGVHGSAAIEAPLPVEAVWHPSQGAQLDEAIYVPSRHGPAGATAGR